MKVDATFITSAAGAADFPGDGLPEVALVGRSNVGKSSLINALVRQQIARTSAAPARPGSRTSTASREEAAEPLYLVDLPGYGYARGGSGGAVRRADRALQAALGMPKPRPSEAAARHRR